MQLLFNGHSYRYAVEQSLLSWLPGVSFTDEASKDCLLTGLTEKKASARLILNGRCVEAEAELDGEIPGDALLRDRVLQRLLKTAIFRAVAEYTGVIPPWGALTGVRPAKLSARFLAELSEDEAVKAMERDYFVSPERAKLCVSAGTVSRRLQAALAPQDAVLYMGIPFCPSRCVYCSFVSHSVEKSFDLVEPYVEALCREIEGTGRLCREAGLRIRAFYMGGGTPTTLTAEQLRLVLQTLRASFELADCHEYTVEAGRPDTITEEKLRVLTGEGVTRISINPQSMNEAVLNAIGRRHSPQDVLDCYETARKCFGGEINMDLIAGLPKDDSEGFRRSLETLIALKPENITVHSLTKKRGADMHSGNYDYPSDAAVGEMLGFALRRLPEAGYSPYYLYRQKFSAGGFENTGWSLPGHECIYNVCMMEELCHVLSLGAGGATKRVFPGSGKILRCTNKKYPYEYNRSAEAAVEEKRKLFFTAAPQ